MYYVNPLAGYIVNFIFSMAAIVFALMAVTNMSYKKRRLALLAVLLMGLSLFLTSSFDPAVSNPHLSETLRGQEFRKELIHQGVLCLVAAIIFYLLRVRPERSSQSRLKDLAA